MQVISLTKKTANVSRRIEIRSVQAQRESKSDVQQLASTSMNRRADAKLPPNKTKKRALMPLNSKKDARMQVTGSTK